MKYSISINQRAIVEADLHHKTDLVDWAILDYVLSWQGSQSAKRLDNKVWLNYQHLINKMPMLHLKSKQSVSNRIKKLRELNLLDTYQAPDKRLYVCTSELFFNVTQFRKKSSKEDTVRVPEKGQDETIVENQGDSKIKSSVPFEEHPVPSEELSVPEKGHSYYKQILPTDTRTTTTEKEGERSGGDLIIFPKKMKKPEVTSAKKIISGLDDSIAQEIIDVLGSMIEAGQIKKNPIAVLNGLIRKYKSGDLDPSTGHHIAQRRIDRARVERNIKSSGEAIKKKVVVPLVRNKKAAHDAIKSLKTSVGL